MKRFEVLERGVLTFAEPNFCWWYMNCPIKVLSNPR